MEMYGGAKRYVEIYSVIESYSVENYSVDKTILV
jgi:hypothetical protein